jgi:integrase
VAKIAKRRGKWVVDWYDPVTKKRSREVCVDREAAKRRLGEVLKNGERIGIKSTLREYALWWLENCAKGNIADSTYEEYERVLRKHVYPMLGDKPFSKVTRTIIRELIAQKKKEGLESSTIRNILAPIRGMYNQAADESEPIANPASRMGKYNKRTAKPEINPYTREEVPAMLQKALELIPLYYPLLLCAVRTGIRQGELIALKASDINFQNRLIHVQRTLSRGKLKPPKSGKTRMVDMSKQLSKVLAELKPEPEAWLFQSSKGSQLDRFNLGKVWRGFLKDGRLRKIRFHDLRHTFASLHIQNGENLKYICDQMGHSSIKVTVDVYGHLVPGGNRTAADRLDDKED